MAEYAFHYAKTHGQEKVSAIHKANIMQKTDGLFLKVMTVVSCKFLLHLRLQDNVPKYVDIKLFNSFAVLP